MNDWRYITVQFDLKKILVAALMALCIWVSCKTGMGDALLFIIPCGIATLVSNE